MKLLKNRLKEKREAYWFKKFIHLKDKVEDIKDIKSKIGSDDEYQRGLSNGLEIALSILEDHKMKLIIPEK